MNKPATSEALGASKQACAGAGGSTDLFGARLPNAHNRLITGSSDDMTWPTPQPVFDALNAEFGFTLDPCCVPATAKCAKYYTPKEDGLKQDWSGERVFMNPPYGRWLKPWMRKAYEESQRGALVVCLVPARVDTAWWHDYASKGEIRFPRGRIKNKNGQSWPFPVAIVIFRPDATTPDATQAGEGCRLSFCLQMADLLESPPPYRAHKSKELWVVLDAHGDSVVWSEQELAAQAVVEALNAANNQLPNQQPFP